MEDNNSTNDPSSVLDPTSVVEPIIVNVPLIVPAEDTIEKFVATENAVVAGESSGSSKNNMLLDLLRCRCGNVNYEKLSKRKNQLVSKIEEHIDEAWNWGRDGLSKYAKVTKDFIHDHIEKSWDFGVKGLSANINTTMDIVEEYIDRDWDFAELSKKLVVDSEFLTKYSDKLWDWNRLLKRYPDIVHDVLLKQKGKEKELINRLHDRVVNPLELLQQTTSV